MIVAVRLITASGELQLLFTGFFLLVCLFTADHGRHLHNALLYFVEWVGPVN